MASSSSRASNEKKRRQRNEEDHEVPGSHQKKKKMGPVSHKRKKNLMSARSYRKLLDRKAIAESSEHLDAERTNARGEGTEADCHQEMLESREPTPNGDVNLSSHHKKQFSSQCSACSKLQREDNYSAPQVFCSCNSKAGEVLTTSSESLGGVETKDNTCSADGDPAFTQLKDLDAILRDDDRTVCVMCKHPGFLLRCCGRGCRAGYHLACLDPPLSDVPPGLWLCFCCLRKKMELGVYSVSEGIESVLGFKEELQKEKHYFVKYKGLAHFYNDWIPESQLLCEDPTILAKFNKKHQKEQVNGWKHKWMEPRRLLQKRFLMPPVQDNECSCGHGDDFEYCYHEWFVKWKGLGYEHATWEFENSPFLCSVEGKALINTYERRREEAKKASDHSRVDKICLKDLIDKQPRLPDGCTADLDNDHLDSISRILSFWDKKRNAVLIDDKECIVKSILFVLNLLRYMCRPFLIISATSSLSVWEDEFDRLAPSVNVVVYNGNKHVRNMIRTLEFYEEGGCIMLEVLLACPEVIVEDLDALDCIGWQAIIIDDCQKSGISKHLEKFVVIPSVFRLLLWNSPLKDNVVDYLKLLSLLDPRVQENIVKAWKLDSTKSDDALAISKERLAPYVVYEGKQSISTFVEYWVPVQLSEVQIKEYCSILASNSHLLHLRPRDDCVESLLDVLFSIQKCCDHPYLVNGSLRQSLIKTQPVVEYLNVDVNASGKLHFLDKILQEVKNQGLRVIILFQSSVGSERNRMGDYLCDVLCQRFGDECYAYVDSRMDKSEIQSILQSFNDKGKEKFVIAIDTRSCRRRIKLSSVDAVVIYDSDWNPLNDLKALQKITIFSPVQEVKVFRLYSPYTVEEKVLELAKKDGGLEVDIRNTSTRLRHSLLSWGAAHLFSRLKELPQVDSVDSCPKLFSDNSLLRDILDLLTQLPESIATCDGNCSNIVKAHLKGAAYSSNIRLYGEKGDLLSLDGDPTLFWSKLLETNSPKFLPRIRRSAQRPDGFVNRSESETYDLKKGNNEVTSQEAHLQCKGLEDERSGETAVPVQTTLSNSEPDPNSSSVASVVNGIHAKKPGGSKCLPSSTAMMTDVTHSLQVPENPVHVSNDTIAGTSTLASTKVRERDEESRFPLHKKDVPKGFLQEGNANVTASDLKKGNDIGVVSQETHLQCKGLEDERSGETAVPVQTTLSNSEPDPNSSSATSVVNGIHVKKPGASKCLPSSTAMMTDITHSLQVPENLVHVSNDTIAGTSTLASTKVQEMDEESQFPLHKKDVPKGFLQEGNANVTASDLKKGKNIGVVSQETYLQCKGQEDQRSGETAVPVQTTLSNSEPEPTSSSATSVVNGIHVKKPGASKCLPSSTAMMTDVTHSLQVPENPVHVSNDTIAGTSTLASTKVRERDEESRFPLHKKDVPKGFLQEGNANVTASDLKKGNDIGVVSQETHLQCKGLEDERSGETAVPVQTTLSNSEPDPNSSSATSVVNGIHVKKPGASKCLPSSTAMMTDVTPSLQVPENLVHVSNDTIAGTSTLASSKVQEMDEESQFPLHKKDVLKGYLQEGNANVTTSDHTYPELRETRSHLPSNCLFEAFACAVTSDTLPSDHLELEEGEIREDDDIQTWSRQQISKEVLLLKEEILKKRINLIDETYSARLEKLLLSQNHEVTEFKNQVNQEEEKLNSLDLKLISATYNDLEVSDVMRKLKQEFSNHVKCQRKKLSIMQIEARIKEKEIKDQWLEKAKMGTLVNSFDSLPLSATGFRIENFKFGVQVGTHGSSGNAFSSYGSSSESTSRSVGCIEPSRPSTVLGVVPNEGMLPILSENEMSICNSTCPIAVESAKQNRTTFDISEANTSGGPGDEILRTKSRDTLRNISSETSVGSIESSEKKRNLLDIFSTSFSAHQADGSLQTKNPASRCDVASGKILGSTEVSSGLPAIATEKEGKKIFTETISSVCQSKGVNEVEFVGPTSGFSSISPLEEVEKIQTEKGSAACQSRSVDVVKFVEATVSSQETEHILIEEESPACQSKSLNVVESKEPSRLSPCISKTILFGGIGDKSPETEVLVSPCEIMNATSENVDKTDIVTGTSAESHGDAQLDLACLTSSQQNPINSSLPHTSNHAGYANSGLYNQVPSVGDQERLAVSRTELASSVSPDNMIPISDSGGPELIKVEHCNHIPEASEPALQWLPSSMGLTSVMPHYERLHVDIGSVQVPRNQPDCSAQLNTVLPPTSTMATSTGIGQVNNSLAQSFTLSVPPIFNVPPKNTSFYHLRGPTIQPEMATSAPRQPMPQQGHYSDPFHNEIIRLHKKELELSQLLKEKKRKLELECDKELEKVRKKYASLIQDNEAEFTKQRKGIMASRSLICMNKELAEQFRKCFVQNKRGTTTVSQGNEHSNSMQQLLQLPRPGNSPRPILASPLSFGSSQGQRIRQGQFSPTPVLASPLSFGVYTPLMPLSFGVSTPLMPTPPNPPFDSPLRLPRVSPSLASAPMLQPTPNGAAVFSKGLNRAPAGSHLNYQVGIDHLRTAPHLQPIRSQPNTQQNRKLRNPQ